MKLKDLKVEKRSFLRLRNKYGEVIVCLDVGNEDDNVVSAGFAFCNPQDFNLRRSIRSQKGHGLAVKRVEGVKGGVPGSAHLILDNPLGSMTGEERLERVRDLAIRYLSEGQFGFKPYTGHNGKEGEFVRWFVPFVKKLRGEDDAEAA